MQWFMMSLFENLLPPLHKLDTLQNKVTYRAWQSRECLLKVKFTIPNLVLYYYETDSYICIQENFQGKIYLGAVVGLNNRSFNHKSILG